MRRLLLTGWLWLAGCFNPDDIFPVHGAVTSDEAQVGQRVQLLRESRAEYAGRCDTPVPFKETRTDDTGAFAFEVFRAQAQKLTGLGDFCFRAETTFPSGTRAYANLYELGSEVTLPPLPDWRPELRVEEGEVRFAPVVPLPPEAEAATVVHRVTARTAAGELAWQGDDVVFHPESGLPVRVPVPALDVALDEFDATLAVEARLLPADREFSPFGGPGTPAVEVVARSEVSTGRGAVPLSRYHWCPRLPQPCALTDGLLAPVDLHGVENVRVQLFGDVPRAVVLRGFVSEALLIAVSLTGSDEVERPPMRFVVPVTGWNRGVTLAERPLEDGGVEARLAPEPRFVVLLLDGVDFPVWEVKVTAPSGIERLSELSVF